MYRVTRKGRRDRWGTSCTDASLVELLGGIRAQGEARSVPLLVRPRVTRNRSADPSEINYERSSLRCPVSWGRE